MVKKYGMNDIAKEFKKRDNPLDFKSSEAIVINLTPLVLSVLGGGVKLTQDENLIFSEWFQLRWDIDKTFALSADVPSLLSQAKGISETHSYTGAPCSMPNAISLLANAITKVSDELLALKLDLKVNDKVIVVPSSREDKFFLMDKISDKSKV